MTTTFRACYFVAADGQGSICLTSEDQAHLPDADLIEAAVSEARAAGLIGHVRVDGFDYETGKDIETVTTEQDVRDGLRVSEYTS